MSMIDQICHRVAKNDELKTEDTTQASRRATVHVMLKHGGEGTLCGQVDALDVTRVSVLRIVTCAACNAELKKIRQRNSRDGQARAQQRRRQQAEQAAQEESDRAWQRRLNAETIADALFAAGWKARNEPGGYDPRGTEEWQAVVDAITGEES